MTLTHSTVSGNSTSPYSNRGGINNYGTLTINRSIISGNTSGYAPHELQNYGTIISNDFNLFGHNGHSTADALSGFIPGGTDITATSDGSFPVALASILDTSLTSNGGPTQTHALVSGSPAIDNINDGSCPPPVNDQRGVARPQNGDNDGGAACDIGAFELSIASPPPMGATCFGIPATIIGTEGNDTIHGTPGPDVIAGLGGDDFIDGLGGNDVICGDAEHDELRGDDGNDRMGVETEMTS